MYGFNQEDFLENALLHGLVRQENSLHVARVTTPSRRHASSLFIGGFL